MLGANDAATGNADYGSDDELQRWDWVRSSSTPTEFSLGCTKVGILKVTCCLHLYHICVEISCLCGVIRCTRPVLHMYTVAVNRCCDRPVLKNPTIVSNTKHVHSTI